jgi:hypothetical protein
MGAGSRRRRRLHALGDTTRALEWLEQAQRDSGFDWLFVATTHAW